MNIYVSNLGSGVQSEDLKKLFSSYGQVSIRVIMDKMTNRSRGFAFVDVRDKQSAEKAVRELNGVSLDGRTIKVKEAMANDSSSH